MCWVVCAELETTDHMNRKQRYSGVVCAVHDGGNAKMSDLIE